MSLLATNAVWERSSARGTHRLVLLALADHADDRGLCWPSMDRLAHRTRLSKRTVQRLCRDLAADNELTVGLGGGR